MSYRTYLAASFGAEEAVKTLLQKRAEPDASDSYGRTLSSYASQNEHSAIIKLLLEQGIGADSLSNEELIPLLHAVGYSHTTILVQPLATERVDQGYKNSCGRTPLSSAAWNGYDAVVRLLLEIGADVESKGTLYKGTPLLLAAENRHEAVVRLLLGMKKVTADGKGNCGRAPLLYAIKNGYGAVVTSILSDSVVDQNQIDHGGSTLYSIGVRNSHAEVVKILLDTEIVACDSWGYFGRSVFWWAKGRGNGDIEKILFDYAKKRGISLCGDENGEVMLISHDTTSRYCHVCTLSDPDITVYYDVRYATEVLTSTQSAINLGGVVGRSLFARWS